MNRKRKPMRRRAKPAKKKPEAKRPAAGKAPQNERSVLRHLQKELEEVSKRETEAVEQQAATSKILRVISSSPTDVQPVFEAIVASAVRLCDATFGGVFRFHDGQLHIAALAHVSREETAAYHSQYPRPPHRNFIMGRAFLEGRPVHLEDILADPDYDPGMREGLQRVVGFRTLVAVPIVKDGISIGVVGCARREVKPFTPAQIELVKTFAEQAVIAIENVRLFTELEGRNRDLTATAEILRVISSSPTDVQPVFDAIADSARRLFGAWSVGVYRFDGELVDVAAARGGLPDSAEYLRQRYPMRATANTAIFVTRAIVDRAVLQIPDIALHESSFARELGRVRGFRAALAVPMLRSGEPIGAISVTRVEPGPFSDGEVALLQTFADQAVIAVENVRLFNETKEALEQQTATSEILRVISISPTDVQPVFDVIVERAVRLCGARFGRVYRYDGGAIHMVAGYGLGAEGLGEIQRVFPRPASDDSIVGRVILTRQQVLIRDIESEEGVPALSRRIIQALETRSQVTIPMLRAGEPIGAMTLGWAEPEAFDEQQIALLKTFADQAVIAIENVRLFKELEGRNRDISEALEQQTATAEILRAISQSPTDVQPVFDTIVKSAARLCNAEVSNVTRFDGELVHMAAMHAHQAGADRLRQAYPARPSGALASLRAVRDQNVVHIPDLLQDAEYEMPETAMAAGFRAVLSVPMFREGRAIGSLSVGRVAPGRFSDEQVALLQTFADQAVIAVENVRLFKELEARTTELTRSVEQLTALGEISRAVSSTLDVETVLETIVTRASQLAGADGCAIYEFDDATEAFHIRATHNLNPALVGTLRASPLRKGEGAMGRAAETREPTQVADIAVAGAYQSHIRDTLLGAGYRALLSVPLLREGEIIGSLSLNRRTPGEFAPEVVEVLKTFATQSALAIQNARLFREIADKSAQLEVASQHKSEFLANMSHELRTPLNAIIGFSEVLVDRMFGELNPKQDEYLKDIYASGQHLLSLINDILDLSKIEAGRMELEMTDFDLPSAIDNALILVRERASRRGITLEHSVDERLGQIRGDERKVKQVLLNLLSNALKFTPEGGRIDVSAGLHDGVAEIAVKDTGVGIAPEDQEAVFEEFRQVGTADKKAGGTGLGLALSRKFIELHGGRIWLTSTVGAGSTFTFTLPLP